MNQPMPPGWYPDQRDPALVRFWDGRQWTAQTSPAYPAAPVAVRSAHARPSLRDRWRSLRRRTKVLLVVAALVVFGALMPAEDEGPASAGGPSSRASDTDSSSDIADAEGSTPSDGEQVTEAVEEEPEEEVIEEITVPALRSKSVAQARSALRRAGLDVKVVRQASWQPAGQVLKQGTKAGAALLAGAVVTLVVAAPMPRVPGVLGKAAATGKAALVRAGFKVNIVKETVSSGANNVVLRQTPSGTQQAAPGSVVQLVVSNFVAPPPPPKPTPVPLASNCTPGYQPCLPPATDYDCAGGSGDGPAYASGPIRVTGSDPYGLDSEGDGIACES
jgi:beta-lactam-binding protein with PASTA domain